MHDSSDMGSETSVKRLGTTSSPRRRSVMPQRVVRRLETTDGRTPWTLLWDDGKLVLSRLVNPTKHMLLKPYRAWSIDLQVLMDAETSAEGQGDIIIRHTATDGLRRWEAPAKRLKEKGHRIDRGYGPQLMMPLEDWDFYEVHRR